MNFEAEPLSQKKKKKKTVTRKKLLINEQKEGLASYCSESFQTLIRHEMLNAYSFNPQTFVVG